MIFTAHVLGLPFVRGKTVAKGEVSSEKWGNKETKENSQRRPNNNSLAIKQGQGPSVPPQVACWKQPACLGRRHKRHTSDPWVKNIPWRRKWQPFWYSCLGNRTDREASWATAHGVAKHWTWPCYWTHTQGLQITFWALPWELSCRDWNLHQVEESTWWPDCGHDISYHILRTDFKEMGTNQPWKWRLTVLKTIKMMLVRPPRWLPGLTMLCLHVAPPSVCKSSPPVIAELRAWPAFGEKSTLPLPAPVASIQNKANFLFHQCCLFIGFWAASCWTALLVTLAGELRLLKSKPPLALTSCGSEHQRKENL